MVWRLCFIDFIPSLLLQLAEVSCKYSYINTVEHFHLAALKLCKMQPKMILCTLFLQYSFHNTSEII